MTEPATEPTAEPATEPAAEPATEPATEPANKPPTVAVDPAAAAAVLAGGGDVVLVLGVGVAADLAADLAGLRRSGTGRVAVLIGDADDPGVLAAAEEMSRELFAR